MPGLEKTPDKVPEKKKKPTGQLDLSLEPQKEEEKTPPERTFQPPTEDEWEDDQPRYGRSKH